MVDSQLEALRKIVCDTTIEIVRQIGIRQSTVSRIADLKARLRLPIYDSKAESGLRRAVVAECQARGIRESFGLRILSEMISESIRAQEGLLAGSAAPCFQSVLARAEQMIHDGQSVINLGIGETDFGPPQRAKTAMVTALAEARTRYTSSQGILPLREKLAQVLTSESSVEISAEDILITPGARYAIHLALMTHIRPGDEVIIFAPAYPAYASLTRVQEGRPVVLTSLLDDSWRIDIDALKGSINSMTRMIIMNSPANPTGSVIDGAAMREIAGLAAERDIIVLSDEVYSNYSYEPVPTILDHGNLARIMISSFSKTYGMTGFRIGYAVSDSDTIRRMTQLQSLCLTSIPEFIQLAALGALECARDREENRRVMLKRLDETCSLLDGLPMSFVKPRGGLYIFPRLDDKRFDGSSFSEEMLCKKGVCITPGCVYGSEYRQHFRLALCRPMHEVRRAIQLMEEMLQ